MIQKFTRLEANNVDYDIKEGLQARVKDPLWMLGRQKQMGEFEAASGGHLVQVQATYQTSPLNQLVNTITHSEKNIALSIPLEKHVESEEDSAWDAKRLEYNFKIKNSQIELTADDYSGTHLDWYHFDLSQKRSLLNEATTVFVTPKPIKYYGMPSSRWWEHEDGQVNLGDFTRPHYNILTLLLIDFALLSSQEWVQIPLEHPVGNVRQMQGVKLIDSFGVFSEAAAISDDTTSQQSFELFTLAPVNESPSDPTLFYFPHTTIRTLEGKPVEEISFYRDEMANLVWAIEHKYEDKQGKVIDRHSKVEEKPLSPTLYWDSEVNSLIEKPDKFAEGEPGNRIEGPVPLYIQKKVPPLHWIPYVQRLVDEEAFLRRGRTSSAETQYKGKILSESSHIVEEEITRAGIKLIRLRQLARDTKTGALVSWMGRQKIVDRPQPFSHLAFDQLINK